MLGSALGHLKSKFLHNSSPLSALKHKEIVQILVYMVYVYLNIVEKLDKKRNPKDKQQNAKYVPVQF